MMDMMVADVGTEPGHDRAHLHVTGGFERRFFISPAGSIIEGNAREIVLGVKKITSNRTGNKMRNRLTEQQPGPTTVNYQQHGDG